MRIFVAVLCAALSLPANALPPAACGSELATAITGTYARSGDLADFRQLVETAAQHRRWRSASVHDDTKPNPATGAYSFRLPATNSRVFQHVTTFGSPDRNSDVWLFESEGTAARHRFEELRQGAATGAGRLFRVPRARLYNLNKVFTRWEQDAMWNPREGVFQGRHRSTFGSRFVGRVAAALAAPIVAASILALAHTLAQRFPSIPGALYAVLGVVGATGVAFHMGAEVYRNTEKAHRLKTTGMIDPTQSALLLSAVAQNQELWAYDDVWFFSFGATGEQRIDLLLDGPGDEVWIYVP